MKIKFNSDDNLPLNKLLKFRMSPTILGQLLQKMANIIHRFFEMNICMSYKNATV